MEDPNLNPTLKIGGKVLEVIFRHGDIIRLRKNHQIDVTEPKTVSNAEAFERMVILLNAGLGHTGEFPAIPKYASAEDCKEFMAMADLMTYADTGLYAALVNEALLKASPQSKEALERMKLRNAQAALEAAPATTQ